MSTNATIFVVDDDIAVCDSLTYLLEAAGYRVEAYADAGAFLTSYDPSRPGCLILDMQMPGIDGLELQALLAERKDSRPIIFLTGQATVSMTARAFRHGAFDFLEKPVKGETLLIHVRKALLQDTEYRRTATIRDLAASRCATLTQRELEIVPLVAAGHSNKDIARQLMISYRTVELHRTHIMQKTGAHTVIELAAIAQAAGLLLNSPFLDVITSEK